MRYTNTFLIIAVVLGAITYSCSDLQNDVTMPAKIGVHGTGVMDKTSTSFHGIKVKASGLESCRQCHSANFSGGTAGVNCATSNCHPAINVHQAGIIDTTSNNFHGKYIIASNWNLQLCSSCHGTDYSGGVASPTCKTCHTGSAGPEACNTCHGDFHNPNWIAPPKDADRSSDTNDPGVGAHYTHLANVTISTNVACSECHVVPANFSSPGHINADGKAKITFGTFANSGLSGSSYDFSSNKCTNTYCHGNFAFSKANSQNQFFYTADQMEGENFSPKWNVVDGSQGKCGTCHGLPPKGHVYADLTGCGVCHIGIVDEHGNIIDKTKHINGKINVFEN